jgi:transposase InsO family protein
MLEPTNRRTPRHRIAGRPARSDARSRLPSPLLSLERCDDRLIRPYTALVFGQRCRQAGINVSMGTRGSALDNAVCEAFFASLKKELLHRRSWPTRRDAQSAVFAWIEGWYNRRRLHSTLGYLSPEAYEGATLSDHRAPLAASRLASINMIKKAA